MFKKITRGKLERFLAPHATDKRVLDIGSGGSSYDRFFPNRLTADIDPQRGPTVIADVQHMPFQDGEFEVVLCTEVLEHVQNPFLAVSELERVLCQGGVLLLSTRFIYPIHDAPNDYFRYTKYGLRHLFQNWDIQELMEETSGFETLAVLLQRVNFQTKLRFNAVLKLLIFLTAAILRRFNFLIVKEFGDIKKSREEQHIFASGYYLVARKK